MRLTLATIVALTVASMSYLGTTTAAQAPVTSPRLDFSAVSEFIRTQAGIGTSTPSVAVAVTRGHQVLWEEGFGAIDHPGGTPATPHTLYAVASITKTVTATALMVLQARHVLDLDRPANEYLKLAKLRGPLWSADDVTVRHLAIHTAGLGTYDNRNDISGLEAIRRYGIVAARPGQTFDYSNLGYGVLGQIITDVSGRTFQTFVQDDVLRPLGMVDAWAGATPRSRYPVAPRYNSQTKTFSPPMAEPQLPGASVLFASAHELALFGMFHLKARTAQQKAILSDTAIDQLQEPLVTTGDTRHSLAWSITDDQHGYRTLLAQGGTSDSQAWLLLVPSEQISVVVLANSGTINAPTIIDRVLSTMLPSYQERLAAPALGPPPAPAVRASAPGIAPSELAGRWSGKIQTRLGDVPLTMTIRPSGEIVATLANQAPANMTDVHVMDAYVAGRMHGDLGDDYVGPAPYQLRFSLRRVGDKLAGSAITWATAGRLPFWVELTRDQGN